MIAFSPFSILDVSIIPENVLELEKFIIGIIILAFFTLWSFIDIVGHFITLYLIDHTKVVEKYPSLKPIINSFKKINYVFLAFEIIYFIVVYLIILSLLIYFFLWLKIKRTLG